jgi:hypothetical protein
MGVSCAAVRRPKHPLFHAFRPQAAELPSGPSACRIDSSRHASLIRQAPRQPINKTQRFQLDKWCCQTGLNCRPLHYQWSALPLSYGSVPAENRPKRPLQGGPILATRPPSAQARAGGDAIKSVPISLRCPRPASRGSVQLRADPVPDFLAQCRRRLDRPDHDLEFDQFGGRDACVRFSSDGLISD